MPWLCFVAPDGAFFFVWCLRHSRISLKTRVKVCRVGGFSQGSHLPKPCKVFQMIPRVYTYKVTFEEVPHWYWGVHKESLFGEVYLGSPVTHKRFWDFYTPKVQVLEVFPSTEEGWKEAQLVEKRLIRPDLNNPLCLNEGCGNFLSLATLARNGQIQGSRNRGRKHTEQAKQNFRAGQAKPETKAKRSQKTKEVFSRPEVLEAVRQKALDRWANRKEELSASMRGVKIDYKWWVNEEGQLRHCPQPPGPEWKRGRKWRPQ